MEKNPRSLRRWKKNHQIPQEMEKKPQIHQEVPAEHFTQSFHFFSFLRGKQFSSDPLNAATPTELMLPKANIREQETQGLGQSQIPALNPVPGLAHMLHWHHHDFIQGQNARFFGNAQHREGKYCNSVLAWMKPARHYSSVLLRHGLNTARLWADLPLCSTQGEYDTQKGQTFLFVVYLATKLV